MCTFAPKFWDNYLIKSAMPINIFRTFLLGLFISISVNGFALNKEETKESKAEKFDPKEMIMHHVKDAHEFHILDWNGKPISISLPVILWTDNGLLTFMSSEFHHDDSGLHIVDKNGKKFVKLHEKIYQLNDGALSVAFDKEHHPTNATTPLDFSITRNVFMMWVSVIVLLLIFIGSARRYKRSENNVPTGIAGFIEPLVVFVRDEIAIPMIGEHKYKRYMPYPLGFNTYIFR